MATMPDNTTTTQASIVGPTLGQGGDSTTASTSATQRVLSPGPHYVLPSLGSKAQASCGFAYQSTVPEGTQSLATLLADRAQSDQKADIYASQGGIALSADDLAVIQQWSDSNEAKANIRPDQRANRTAFRALPHLNDDPDAQTSADGTMARIDSLRANTNSNQTNRPPAQGLTATNSVDAAAAESLWRVERHLQSTCRTKCDAQAGVHREAWRPATEHLTRDVVSDAREHIEAILQQARTALRKTSLPENTVLPISLKLTPKWDSPIKDPTTYPEAHRFIPLDQLSRLEQPLDQNKSVFASILGGLTTMLPGWTTEPHRFVGIDESVLASIISQTASIDVSFSWADTDTESHASNVRTALEEHGWTLPPSKLFAHEQYIVPIERDTPLTDEEKKLVGSLGGGVAIFDDPTKPARSVLSLHGEVLHERAASDSRSGLSVCGLM